MVKITATGLSQVCKLWFGVSKGLLAVEHLAPKIFVLVNYCWHQLAGQLGWVTPAYHKKECATLHPGVYKHSLLYYGRPDGRFGVRVGTWNLGSLSGKGGDISCDGLEKEMELVVWEL